VADNRACDSAQPKPGLGVEHMLLARDDVDINGFPEASCEVSARRMTNGLSTDGSSPSTVP
jgi:hypothetical protein